MRRKTTMTWLGMGLFMVAGCAPAGTVKSAAAPATGTATAAKLVPQISAAEAAKQAVAAVKQASAAYADAYNARDYAALAAQWTEKAELIEGGGLEPPGPPQQLASFAVVSTLAAENSRGGSPPSLP